MPAAQQLVIDHPNPNPEWLARHTEDILDQRVQSIALLLAEPNNELASGLLFRGDGISPVGPDIAILS